MVNYRARLNWTASVDLDGEGVALVAQVVLVKGANARVSCPTGVRATTTIGAATADASDQVAIMIVPAVLVVGATVEAETAVTITSASAGRWALAAPVAVHGAKAASASARPSGAAGKAIVGVGLCPALHVKD